MNFPSSHISLNGGNIIEISSNIHFRGTDSASHDMTVWNSLPVVLSSHMSHFLSLSGILPFLLCLPVSMGKLWALILNFVKFVLIFLFAINVRYSSSFIFLLNKIVSCPQLVTFPIVSYITMQVTLKLSIKDISQFLFYFSLNTR